MELINKNLVNHVALVLDASSSMSELQSTVIKVGDELIAHLAQQSQDLKQETRVTVYVFANTAKCVIYDMDVLRLPSLADFYQANGWTALIDAALLSQEDLALTPQKYGNHAFLTYILTDGEENQSRRRASELSALLAKQPENWTMAVFVPNQHGRNKALQFGFAAGNIKIWESTSTAGLVEVSQVIKDTTSSYMQSRATGTRGTKNLFNMNTAAVNTAAVKALNVAPLQRGKFKLIPVTHPGGKDVKIVLKDFLDEQCGLRFQLGQNFYQLSKPEKVQADKEVALVRKQDAAAIKAGAPLEVYVGYEVRDFLGLPGHEVKVGPQAHPDYDIFIQSNSNNRHLVFGTRLLVLNPKTK